MFRAVFSNPKKLRLIFESMMDLVSDVNLNFTRRGLSVQTIDSSHVCLIELTIGIDAHFLTDFDFEEDFVLGIHLANFIKALKCGGGDNLILSYQLGMDELQLSFEEDEKKIDLSLKLMTINSDAFQIEDDPESIHLKLETSTLNRVIKDLSTIGCDLDIELGPGKVAFSSSGEIGTAKMTFHEPLIESELPKLSFSLKHLVSMTKACGICEEVILVFSQNLPLCIDYRVGNNIELRYYLAPKINDEINDGDI